MKDHEESIPQQIVRGVIESGEKHKFEMRFSINTAHESIEMIQADTEALLAVPGLTAQWALDTEEAEKQSATQNDGKAMESTEYWRVTVG